MKSISVGQPVFYLDDKLLDVTVRWVQPEYHNGRLLGYELSVAKEPIYNNDDGSYTATNLAYVLDDIKVHGELQHLWPYMYYTSKT